MSLAVTQQVSSAVSPSTPVNEPLFCTAACECELQGTKRKRCLPFTVSQVYFYERNSGESLGFQSWDANRTRTFLRSASTSGLYLNETIHRNGQVQNKSNKN